MQTASPLRTVTAWADLAPANHKTAAEITINTDAAHAIPFGRRIAPRKNRTKNSMAPVRRCGAPIRVRTASANASASSLSTRSRVFQALRNASDERSGVCCWDQSSQSTRCERKSRRISGRSFNPAASSSASASDNSPSNSRPSNS